ncbi:glycosyltransferase family 2 protein [Mesonia aestuariivivens]|uniref:Glycosyltransferase family 2 protein n=1 Tax=Mesonia aestuariivivens TaxID=2796128 RepID=A0ABS6W4J6_9FLAO|nr:glycosyltransferase family 2 protein [Mesonia aestuariivivens]
MKIAVVILNWNGKKLLETFLPSVVKHSTEANLYLADNASEDNSVAFVQQNFPRVQLIQNKENGGYAKGYNDALKHLKEDIFILLNSDVEVTPNWLTPILAHFKTQANTAIIQPKILNYTNKNKFDYAGACGGFVDQLGYPYCRGRIFETLEEDKNQYNEPLQVSWASGACFAIRKEVFFEAGKLDEDYFAHQEEIDLCWRVHQLNYAIWALPQSTVYHLGGGTLHAMHPKKTFLNFRNSLFNLVKNKQQFVTLTILIRMVLDGVAGIKFLIELKPKHFLAILKAHYSFYKYLPKMIKKRKPTYNKEKFSPLKSIVWRYFIEKKTTYRQL